MFAASHDEFSTPVQQVYTWTDFDADVRQLAVMIRALRIGIDRIYAIPRGGLPLGVALSHALYLPLSSDRELSPRLLVVDDSTVTGGSLRPYAIVGCPTAVLVHNPTQCPIRPQFFARCSDAWLAFPWEIASA